MAVVKDRQFVKNHVKYAQMKKASYVVVYYDVRNKEYGARIVRKNENIVTVIQQVNNNYAQTVLEVYNLSKDVEKQIMQARAWEV